MPLRHCLRNLSKIHKQKKSRNLRDFFCDSEAIRTLDPRLRRALLYPAELRNLPICNNRLLPVCDCKDSAFISLCQSFSVFFCPSSKKEYKQQSYILSKQLILIHHLQYKKQNSTGDKPTSSIRSKPRRTSSESKLLFSFIVNYSNNKSARAVARADLLLVCHFDRA